LLVTGSLPDDADTPDAPAPFDRLQFVRRVDWRFLLPSPGLGAVAYGGRRDDDLIRSLALFSTSLTLLDEDGAGDPSGAAGAYDVAVAVDPSPEDLRRLAGSLRAEGSLYVEARGGLGSRRLFGSRVPRALEGTLTRLGFEDVQSYWRFPNQHACEETVPLADERALRYALTRRRSAAIARAKAWLAHGLLSAGLFAAAIPSRSVTARLGARDGSG
jgi:hypothetical protein